MTIAVHAGSRYLYIYDDAQNSLHVCHVAGGAKATLRTSIKLSGELWKMVPSNDGRHLAAVRAQLVHPQRIELEIYRVPELRIFRRVVGLRAMPSVCWAPTSKAIYIAGLWGSGYALRYVPLSSGDVSTLMRLPPGKALRSIGFANRTVLVGRMVESATDWSQFPPSPMLKYSLVRLLPNPPRELCVPDGGAGEWEVLNDERLICCSMAKNATRSLPRETLDLYACRTDRCSCHAMKVRFPNRVSVSEMRISPDKQVLALVAYTSFTQQVILLGEARYGATFRAVRASNEIADLGWLSSKEVAYCENNKRIMLLNIRDGRLTELRISRK